MLQQVKELAQSLQWLRSLLWRGFNPWPGDFRMPLAWQKKKKKKKGMTIRSRRKQNWNFSSPIKYLLCALGRDSGLHHGRLAALPNGQYLSRC